tara:strand:- start:353 stop:1249 length:897 start_codon:yes stop_codon:yes gene_type:complete
MTQITTINTADYAAMAKLMGTAHEKTTSSSSSLARLRINHTPIMGPAEVNGKTVNVEVVEGGAYKLDIPDGPTYYASSVKIRPFMQRFMHKRFIQGDAKNPNRYIKTVMSDNLENDLKDNAGTFNCGKSSGFIKDWNALPKETQDLLRSIKRVRAVFGVVEMINPTDERGNAVELATTPFIWEIDNKDAFKEIGGCFTALAKQQRLPIFHTITANTSERKIPTGASYYVPVASLDTSVSIDPEPEDNELLADFMSWVDNYNNYILKDWEEKRSAKMEEDDVEVVDDIVDIELDDEEVA